MVRHRKSRKTSRKKMEVIKLRKRKGAKENENIKFKKGGLHKSLKFSGTFTKAEMARLDKKKIGQKFTFKGNKFVMTDKLKDQVTLAKTMMSWNKKSRKKRSKKKSRKKKSRKPKRKSRKMRSKKKSRKPKRKSRKMRSKKKSRKPKRKSRKMRSKKKSRKPKRKSRKMRSKKKSRKKKSRKKKSRKKKSRKMRSKKKSRKKKSRKKKSRKKKSRKPKRKSRKMRSKKKSRKKKSRKYRAKTTKQSPLCAPKRHKKRRKYEKQTLSKIKDKKDFQERTKKVLEWMYSTNQYDAWATGLPWTLKELMDKYAQDVLDLMDTKKLSMTIAIKKAVPIYR
jgi:hypothetical protein